MAVPDGYYEWVAIPNGRINYFRPPVATPQYARGAITNGNTKIKRVKIKRAKDQANQNQTDHKRTTIQRAKIKRAKQLTNDNSP